MKTVSSKSSKSNKVSLASGYRTGGNYHAIIATLEKMGVNKGHLYSDFAKQIAKDWEGQKDFEAKGMRNKKTGKTAEERQIQNVRTLQRTADYAAPLLASGAVIDLYYGDARNPEIKGALVIMLNTKSKKPQTPGRQPQATETPKAVKAVKVKAKVVKAASKSASPILSGSDAVAFLKGGKKKAAKSAK